MTVLASYFDDQYVGFVSDVDVDATPPRETLKIQYNDTFSILYSIVGDELAINVVNALLAWNQFPNSKKIALDGLEFIDEVTKNMTHIAQKLPPALSPRFQDTSIYIYDGTKIFLWKVFANAKTKVFFFRRTDPHILNSGEAHIDCFGYYTKRQIPRPSSVDDLRVTLESEINLEDKNNRQNLVYATMPKILSGRFFGIVTDRQGNKLFTHPYTSFSDMILNTV